MSPVPEPHPVDAELLGFLDTTLGDDDSYDTLALGEWPDLSPRERIRRDLPYGYD